jgi:hypothetical protein
MLMQASEPHTHLFIIYQTLAKFIFLTRPSIWYMLLANVFLISFLQETWNHTLIAIHHSNPTWRIWLWSMIMTYSCHNHEARAGSCCRSLIIWIGEWLISFMTITSNKKCVNRTMKFSYFLLSLYRALIKFLLVDT